MSLMLDRATVQAKQRAGAFNRDARTVLGAAKRRRRGPFADQLRQVRPKLEIPELGAAKDIWAIAMVKSEADVIENTVRHLVAQGVAHFVVMDNGSSDGTLQILRRLENEIPGFHVGLDHEPAHYQGAKMTVLADAVRRAGATWVLPFDADELWYGAHGTVADTLEHLREPLCGAKIHNVFPAPGNAFQVDDTAQKLDKVAFRPTRTVTIGEGNHSARRPGPYAEELRVLHLSWRSYEQFAAKLRNGAQALEMTDLPQSMGDHWRSGGRLNDTELREHWSRLEHGDLPELGWTPVGRLRPLPAEWPRQWATLDLTG